MTVYEMKRNDTRPKPDAILKFNDGSLAQLTGASVRFIARHQGTDIVKIDGVATITDIPTAAVEYDITADDSDTAGNFDVEWEVTFADATEQTWPTRGSDLLVIAGDLA